jgi:ubiquinone/menaquinone biosynthesis C-methylase UbiE
MTIEGVATSRNQYVEFWNNVLVPKFVRWRHILVDGLTLHSAKVFPSLTAKPGDKVVDAGCGFDDTAIQLARLVGPTASNAAKPIAESGVCHRGRWEIPMMRSKCRALL